MIATAARALLLSLLALGAVGCGGKSTTILESDVPAPPDFEVRFSEDISRSGGALTGGRFLLSGSATDLERLTSDTATRFTGGGWREVRREIGPDRSLIVFTKDRREVTVEIDRRRVQPLMSTAIVTVAPAAGGS